MRQIRHFLTMATLAVMGAMMAGCATEDNVIVEPQQPADQTRKITLTTTVTLDGGSATRALTESGVKTFAKDDQIAVKYYKRNEDWAYKTAISNKLTTNDIADDGKTATFTVTLDDPDPNKTEVRYVYPAYLESDDERALILQSEQDGTLETLAKTFDYCEGTGDIDHSGSTPALPSITLKNQLALAKFTIRDGSSDITSGVTQLMIDDGTRGYVVNRTAAAGPIWVAMYPIAKTQTVKVTAVKGTDLYQSADITGKELAKSSYYNITVTTPKIDMSNIAADYKQPLTFQAKDGAATVKFTLGSAELKPVEYSIDNGTTWATYNSGTDIELASGDKVMFRGNNASYGIYDKSTFSTVGDCYVYGNVMSLVNATAFPVVKTLTAPYTFSQLFLSCNYIYSHESKKIVLPATTLANSCYDKMFTSCDNLTTAPALPATTLTEGCYSEMFFSCISLTTAPELPATTLTELCYCNMFQYCSVLNYVKCLATTIPNSNCTDGWLAYVSNTGTFIINDDLSSLNPTPWTRNVHGIPSGWTVKRASQENE